MRRSSQRLYRRTDTFHGFLAPQLNSKEKAKLCSGRKPSGCFVNNLLAFAPTGKILFAALNYDGSHHDSVVARVSGYYDLAAALPANRGVATDEGFLRSGKLAGKIFRRSTEGESPVDSETVEKQTVSFRECAGKGACRGTSSLAVSSTSHRLTGALNAGMRVLQAATPRLLITLTSDKTERAVLLELAVGMHQLRMKYVGLDRLAAVYDIAEWTSEAAKVELPRYKRRCGLYWDDF